ncbi:Cobyrinic acid a,c-diamide synthetase [Candidatus Syntrophocurvum alkaliphilum]|uniref:Cobyrinate a,c-diamide synthase n=1 Tax=Candidatus Syntrophocurvum alkaliphilum TaxID=2293317 RepID=A0A6I6DLH6_9FIRM|nr:cobyrinate a,c-diamide synthase [Candidatus Syntrophocurvum alkaliphilum]QGU00255.1 Cobyrinic acid a,c-diamide synthetase [Candidatus Syntrophocurvum alkaliphilum]
MSKPRVLIAGVQSGVGKTTLTLGILAALKRKGLKVQPFKVGPDYIDPSLHYHACNRKSHNLDSWMSSEEVIKHIFFKEIADADIAVIEGVMGLFDGARNEKIKGSSADIAIKLNTPVILVINAKGMAASCIALIKGFMDYEPRLNLKGVILNHAGSDYHKKYLKTRIEEELGIVVLGCLRANEKIKMPERYLGLLPAEENNQLGVSIDQMAKFVEEEIDLSSLLKIASNLDQIDNQVSLKKYPYIPVRIAVARDEAFTFYYQDNLNFLEELGAKLIYFSPMRDKHVPLADGLYLGGGFPEQYLSSLANNHSMIESVVRAHKNSLPIYAECGGYIYLCKNILDKNKKKWNGAGIIPYDVEITGGRAALGYVTAEARFDSILGKKGNLLKGHEFHYSQITNLKEESSAYIQVNRENKNEGYIDGNLLGSYLHLHFRSNPESAINYLRSCNN